VQLLLICVWKCTSSSHSSTLGLIQLVNPVAMGAAIPKQRTVEKHYTNVLYNGRQCEYYSAFRV